MTPAPACGKHSKTEVNLMTDDRPLYTFSLQRPAPALDTILGWLDRYRADRPSPFPSRAAQVEALRQRWHELLLLDAATDDVVRSCGATGPVPGSVGRRGGALLIEYVRWRETFSELQIEPYLRYFYDELDLAADYRQSLLHAGLQLAFNNDPDNRAETGRRTLDGLGPATKRLARLGEHLTEVDALH